MGYIVSAEFRPHVQHPAPFWWPLLFEALRRHGLSYDDPDQLPLHVGRYLATDAASDYAQYQASFRALWERLSDTTSGFLDVVSFWTPRFPGWELEASVGDFVPADTPATPHCWTLDLGEEDGAAPAEDRLALLIAVACEIAELCGPGIGEWAYEHHGVRYRFGAIGQPLELTWWASPSETGTFAAPIRRAQLPSGQEVVVVERFPSAWSPGPLTVRLPDHPVAPPPPSPDADG
jgi:hypothetical protein